MYCLRLKHDWSNCAIEIFAWGLYAIFKLLIFEATITKFSKILSLEGQQYN